MKDKILIFLVIIISLMFTSFIVPRVFFANTPRINPKFISELKDLPSSIIRLPEVIVSNLFAKKNNTIKSSVAQVRQIDFPIESFNAVATNKIATGVYAGSTGYMKYFDIKQSEVEWVTIVLTTKNGKVVHLQYPKGNPPAKEMLEIIKAE